MQGLPKIQSTHIDYRAHRAVIFAIAWHLVCFNLNLFTSMLLSQECCDARLLSSKFICVVATILEARDFILFLFFGGGCKG